ncbi:MAG: Holliday junction resolvase RuvX [Nevskiaceae bacterium]|nr:MAG: Holliday junction resolvase RuvX [Nevskiaceae bacterium]TBR74314.1 MAG: Holliday junction resolvase RuvX [Nevskiaceae bacterium]
MPGTCLAFDYGLRRIGVAVGSGATGQARALTTLHHTGTPDWRAITVLVAEWQPEVCIVGLPLNEDGTEQAMSQAARAFAGQLEQRLGQTVHLCDERFSSRTADDEIRKARASGRRPRKTRKGDRDGMAACVILEQFLRTELAVQHALNPSGS